MDCYTAALRILNFRFNSAAELRRKLRAKKFDEETIAATLDRLREEKWLDDDRFADSFVRTRATKRIGRLRILRELSEAGVSSSAAARAVAEHLDPERERAELEALCRRKLESLRRRRGDEYAASDEGRAKLMASLARSGFDTSAVIEVVERALRE
ncbi:MAG TPA: regulatory protein RecX [Thermoanaerobaculia bacterium]|nr:regulatory protein RecX [Thermoanaerobaculia bacterium]